jgi:biopolymer transport protein ExbD
VSWKRILGLALAAVALTLLAWGLFFAKPPLQLKFFKVAIVTEEAQPSTPVEPKPVHVYINRDGSLWVGDKPSSLDRLVGDIVEQATTPDKDLQRIFLHENVEGSHKDFKAVMDRINAAGWRRIELDTQRGDPHPAARR